MSRAFKHWAVLASATAILAFHPATGARAQSAPPADTGTLRICADPNYLPFSDTAGDGFENKIADVLAKSMSRKTQFVWASYRGHGGFPNFLADNLEKHRCDVIMDLPYGDGEAATTDPYYRSSYVFITKKQNNYDIRSMKMPVLRSIKIGYEDETTPETALKMLDLLGNATTYHIADDPNSSPEQMLQAVEDGKLGVVITWKPAIGGFLKKYPDLVVTPVPTEGYAPGVPRVNYTYNMAIGVRPDDTQLKAALNTALKADKPQIDTILAQYEVGTKTPDTSGGWIDQ